ncbi:MAG: anaerobic ribonucleoside-triphosphate reductase activating protein [Candidatus Magasanikbacteria bacterium]|nr:anaerobic ribonucleoside-triphosphate reductase activating protein [Candidatus Magasanikbacteria bacterium]
MLISGIQPFTMLDYPGETAAIIFTAGCNFRCGYCHNPEFVVPELLAKIKNNFIPETAILNFLESRRGLLTGVVVSGGEPTIQPDLLEFLKKIKNLGFKVKLDTNGNRPEFLRAALAARALDYIAMDYKTSASAYPALVGPLAVAEKIAASRELLKNSDVEYEFRATLIKEVHSDILLTAMQEELAGAKRFFLQQFRPGITLAAAFGAFHPFSVDEMEEIATKFRRVIPHVAVRA